MAEIHKKLKKDVLVLLNNHLLIKTEINTKIKTKCVGFVK